MTDRRQTAASNLDAEKTQRLHVCSRIKELRGNCEHLTRERDELSAKLTELTKIVDTLIDEKRDNRYDPYLEIDLTTYRVNRGGTNSGRQKPGAGAQASTTTTGIKKPLPTTSANPNSSFSSSSSKDHDFSNRPPSSAFKMKMGQCLEDIAPKINRIATLTAHLCSGTDDL